jgi:Flp pilus assembly secretin CpaC
MRTLLLWLATFGLSAYTYTQAPAAPPSEAGAPAPAPPAAPAGPPPLADIQQVQMHVWISETSEQGVREIGNNIGYNRLGDNNSDSLQQVNTSVFDPQDQSFTVTMPVPDQDRFLPPLRPDQLGNFSNGLQTQGGMGLNYSLLEANHGTYDGIFRAIDLSTDVDLMSKPELLVISGQQAIIHAGGEVPFQTVKYTKGNPQIGVEFRPVGVEMTITPVVREDNLIELAISKLDVTDISRVDQIRGLDLPIISKRSQTGTILIPNGQSFVIGGLTEQLNRTSERRVPVIGKVPVLGTLFRSRKIETQNSTLLIFVSPTVVDLRNLSAQSTTAMEFWTEGNWRSEENIVEEIDLLKENY